MSDGDLVLHENVEAELQFPDDLGPAIVENAKTIKNLQLTLAKMESDVQRAVEEQKLLHELHTLDQLTLLKIEKADPNRKNKMPLTEESVAKIISLKDAIKLEVALKGQLEAEEDRIKKDSQTVEIAITAIDGKLMMSTENSGFTGQGGRPYEALDNVFRRHQLELAALEDEQKSIKTTMGKLTKQIEELTAQLEAVKTVEDDLRDADDHLKGIRLELEGNKEAFASLKRILAKKEKMLAEIDKKDLMKEVQKLEGDKRVLHADLGKQTELMRVNERAILANDDRIRKLEARLAGFDGVLPNLFNGMDARGESIGRPPEIPEDAVIIPVGDFDDAINELQVQRDTLAHRDERLEELDANIEVLERKVDIVHSAQESQTAKAANEISDIDKEKQRLEDHVDQIAREFEAEKERLASERSRWETIARKA